MKKAAKQVKGTDVVIFLSDWNAKVKSERHGNVVGQYDLGERNDRSSRLITF